MIEAITSLIDNYKSKIRNPLIGTIISVWLIHNWKIVYAIFNFDKKYNMHYKIKYIQNYFLKKDYLHEIWTISWISFSVIIGTFILLAISRFFTNGYYKVLEPWVKGIVARNEIFTVEEKKKLETEIKSLNMNLEKIKDLNSKADNRNELLISKITHIENEHNNKVIELAQQNKDSFASLTLIEGKNKKVNKVVTFFEDIVNSMSPVIKNELDVLIKNRRNPNSSFHANYVGLKKFLFDKGIQLELNGQTATPALGFLFLDYYEEFFMGEEQKF